MRHKHSQELSAINEQLENFKKTRGALEKSKQTLEAENADLATELRNVNSSRQENDRRRKQAESQIAEIQVKFRESICKLNCSGENRFRIYQIYFFKQYMIVLL